MLLVRVVILPQVTGGAEQQSPSDGAGGVSNSPATTHPFPYPHYLPKSWGHIHVSSLCLRDPERLRDFGKYPTITSTVLTNTI